MNGSCEISCDGLDQGCVDIPSSKSIESTRKESSIGRQVRKSLQFGITWPNSRVY